MLEVPELGAVSQVKQLEEAQDEMLETVAYLTGLDPAEVELQLVTSNEEQGALRSQKASSPTP
ncbi:Uncharacterised protein [Actinomyces bovis]|uniref:Uncharacterized protein n=1 Tax=Actinomyces bovis TaxID=1658 RepID=A0ABY1VQN8_9ACTO|nr:Uncharacterised protein [Actinomyces bovis]VEG53907.1 Uncharacterised protein [Actinomyces israelii]